MAKFCTKCGRPLQDGVPCICTQSNVQPETDQQINNQQEAGNKTVDKATGQAGEYLNKFGGLCKEFIGIVINLFKRPYDTTKLIVQEEAKVFGIGGIAVKTIVTALIVFLYLVHLDSLSFVKIDNKFQPVATVVFISLVKDLVLAYSMSFSTTVFKKPVKFYTMLGVTGIKAVLNSIVIVCSFLLCLINGTLGLLLYIIGSLIAFMFLNMAFDRSHSIDDNQKSYAMAVAVAITAVVVFILCIIFKGMLLKIVGTAIQSLIGRFI